MSNELELLISKLKEESEDKYNQGSGLWGVSDGLSEWNYGYSEGIDYAIEELEKLIK